jgi:hypothetical protein
MGDLGLEGCSIGEFRDFLVDFCTAFVRVGNWF